MKHEVAYSSEVSMDVQGSRIQLNVTRFNFNIDVCHWIILKYRLHNIKIKYFIYYI